MLVGNNMKKSFLNNILKLLCNKFNKKELVYKTILSEELPDKLNNDTIYILGQGTYYWSAAMLCPCGCGQILQMSLHKEGRPRWEITINNNGTISLFPSIKRMCGCKSHFFFQKGRIKWCK